MLEWLMLTLAVLGALAASYTDIKHGIIPNKLSFSLFFAGIAGNLAIAFSKGNYSLALDLGKAVLVTFAVGYALWLLGGMAAGDVKEFLFIAALLPKYPEVLLRYFSPSLAWYPFPLSVFINTFVAIFPFLFIYSLAISTKKVSMRDFFEPLLEPQKKLKSAFLLMGAFSFGTLLGKSIAALGFIFLIFLIKGERYRIAVASAPLLLALYTGSVEPIAMLKYYIFITVVLLIFAIFWNSLKILRGSLKKEVRISNLEEGTIAAEEIYIRDGEVIREEKDFLEKIKDYISSRGTMSRGTLVAGTGAAGLTVQQIEALQKLVREGRLEDRVKVKARMPFAPVILLGLLLALGFGDLSRMVGL